ncbi:MAG: glycosyltransferase family 4 protein [Ginsengibacter sp.]
MPKTLVLIPDLNIPGGVSNYYKTLRLDANSHISYFTINRNKPESSFKSVLRLFNKYSVFIFKLLKYQYEIVIVNPSLDEGKSFHRDLIFIIITRLLKRKSIVFFHGWFDPFEEKIKKSKFKSFLFRISYAKATKYLVLGEVFKNKLIGLGVPRETEFFVETMVADSNHIEELNLNDKLHTYEKEIIFLFLSRMEKEKGIYIAIDAFQAFLIRFPQRKTTFIIAGDGIDLPAVKNYVKEKMIPNIKFLGFISGENKRQVLLKSHVMIFPSFTEGLPNAILEGMLYGMPVVSRAVGGIPQVIQQNVNGFLTESFDSAIFTDFLSKLACDSVLYKNIAEINHNTAIQRFTSEKVKERIFTILEDCKN